MTGWRWWRLFVLVPRWWFMRSLWLHAWHGGWRTGWAYLRMFVEPVRRLER